MNREENKQPLRILHVVTRMDAAGIETFIMNIYRQIDRNKIQFDFLTHRKQEGFYDSEIKKMGGRIFRVPSINPFHHKNYIKELDKFFLNHQEYKIVHSHINTFSMYVLRSAKKNEVPVRIAHSHISSVPLDYKFVFREYCRKRITEFPTDFFACSEDAGKWLYSRQKFEVINNGIDVNNFQFNANIRNKKRNELGVEGFYVLGNIGRFTSQKNQLFLLDILKEVRKKEPKSKLLLVGKGRLKEKIQKKSKKLGLENNVIILEDRKDINELLMAMDVFIFPSLYEGLGIVAVEAQAAGLPTLIAEKLPKELRTSSLVREISLEDSASYWGECALKMKNIDRENLELELLKNNFEITRITNALQEFYLEKNSN
ncbi:glycosyltransferase family 1 protein [Vagococcus fluvialis]|uniref:glycosyltransferase family 1 protein n=1 Tax=Vagococcus fluvialis TaxID=2738 RepID=UPI003B224F98